MCHRTAFSSGFLNSVLLHAKIGLLLCFWVGGFFLVGVGFFGGFFPLFLFFVF